MAVVKVKEVFQRDGSLNSTEMSTVRKFQVITDEPTDDWIVVSVADDGTTAIPAVGDEHPSSTEELVLYCTDVAGTSKLQKSKIDEGELAPGGALWEVTANYKTLGPDEVAPGTSPIYPATPAQYSTTGAIEEKGVHVEADGTTAIKNFAGDPYKGGVPKKFVANNFQVTVNLSSHPDYSLQGKVNSGTFMGIFSTGQIMCGPIGFNGPFKTQTGTVYRSYTFNFYFAAETWNVRDGKILNQGLREKDADDNIVPIQDDGENATEPWPLDSDGHAIRDGSTPTYTQYNLYTEASFSSIDFS